MLVFEEDDREVQFREGNTRWVVTLSDDRKVFDNNREDVPSWLELHDYCYLNNLYIKEMYVHFRSNYVSLPPNKDGYFFSRSVLGSLVFGNNEYFFNIGYEENDQIFMQKVYVPSLQLYETEIRNPTDCIYQLISRNYEGTPKRKRLT